MNVSNEEVLRIVNDAWHKATENISLWDYFWFLIGYSFVYIGVLVGFSPVCDFLMFTFTQIAEADHNNSEAEGRF